MCICGCITMSLVSTPKGKANDTYQSVYQIRKIRLSTLSVSRRPRRQYFLIRVSFVLAGTNSVHVSSTIIHNEALSSGFLVRPLLPALGFSLSLSLTVFLFLPFLASSSRFFCQLFALLCAFLLSKSAKNSLQCWVFFSPPPPPSGLLFFSPHAGSFQMQCAYFFLEVYSLLHVLSPSLICVFLYFFELVVL